MISLVRPEQVGAAVKTCGTREQAAHRNNLVVKGVIFIGIGYHLCFEELSLNGSLPMILER